jgi:hypothetical protein
MHLASPLMILVPFIAVTTLEKLPTFINGPG